MVLFSGDARTGRGGRNTTKKDWGAAALTAMSSKAMRRHRLHHKLPCQYKLGECQSCMSCVRGRYLDFLFSELNMEEEGDGDESPAEDLGKDLDVDAEESDNGSEDGGVAGQEGLRSSLSLPALSGINVIRRPSMPGRKGRGSVTPYSTSSEESEAVEVRIRRRKKRKRPVGGLEKELRQKVAWIQDALKNGDRDRLGQLAASKGGLLSDEVIINSLH